MIKIPFKYSAPDYTDLTSVENLEKITSKQVPVKLGTEDVGHLNYIDFGDFYDKRDSMCGAIVFSNEDSLIGSLLTILAVNDMFRLLPIGSYKEGSFENYSLHYISLIPSKIP